jgi:hypothetical protein
MKKHEMFNVGPGNCSVCNKVDDQFPVHTEEFHVVFMNSSTFVSWYYRKKETMNNFPYNRETGKHFPVVRETLSYYQETVHGSKMLLGQCIQ